MARQIALERGLECHAPGLNRMLVVDTSVWIDYFNGTVNAQTDLLDNLLARRIIILGDLILAEILQGFHRDEDYRQAKKLLQAFPIVDMLGQKMAEKSAQNYRQLRKKGVTVRKTMDVMIGTYCIEHDLPLLYTDRDFDPLVKHLGLRKP